jgi:hypothetical protein
VLCGTKPAIFYRVVGFVNKVVCRGKMAIRFSASNVSCALSRSKGHDQRGAVPSYFRELPFRREPIQAMIRSQIKIKITTVTTYNSSVSCAIESLNAEAFFHL